RRTPAARARGRRRPRPRRSEAARDVAPHAADRFCGRARARSHICNRGGGTQSERGTRAAGHFHSGGGRARGVHAADITDVAIILAIEPDRRQAAHLSAVVRHRVGAELILADTTEGALNAIGSRVPDLVLVPALISPQDDAALAAALRVIAAAAHVRILTTPVFSNGTRRGDDGGGLLSRFQ